MAGPRARPIILDCDPGHDDALAMVLALARPELDVRGITTVAGNSTLENTTRNALSLLALLGRDDVPVAAGAAGPLKRPLETAPHVHGTSGLDGTDLPAPARSSLDTDAADFIARTVRASSDPLALVPTGPLTNIALFARRYPDEFARIAEIVLMGGALGAGNITPYAEFNVWVDPEAAAIVLGAGRPVTVMGLDVTHQALFSLEDTQRLEQLGTRTGAAFADLLRFFARFHHDRYGWNGAPIHDAVAVAHLVAPGLVTTQRYALTITTEGPARGQMIGVPAGPGKPGVDVGVAIDRRLFVEMLIEAVAQFG